MHLGDKRRNLPATQDYAFITSASAGQVWATITSPSKTPAFLYGLSAVSTWEPGALLELTIGDDPSGRLCGYVLFAEPPLRLSYSVQASANDPAVYLTWHMRDTPTGCVVRLHIDDPDVLSSALDDEENWLRLVASLEHLLAG
jgi:Activator of Hsp90 ATPase homolog 1-like protein